MEWGVGGVCGGVCPDQLHRCYKRWDKKRERDLRCLLFGSSLFCRHVYRLSFLVVFEFDFFLQTKAMFGPRTLPPSHLPQVQMAPEKKKRVAILLGLCIILDWLIDWFFLFFFFVIVIHSIPVPVELINWHRHWGHLFYSGPEAG